MLVLTSTYDWNWWSLSSSQKSAVSTPAFPLKSACKPSFLDPSLLRHGVTLLSVEDGLGGAWQQYRRRGRTLLLLSAQAGAVLSSAPDSGGYSLLDHAGLLWPEQSHTLGRAAWGSGTLPSPTLTCRHGDCLPASSVGALCLKKWFGLCFLFFFLFFFWQIFPGRGSSPHKCRGEWISSFQL